ncbi:MAG: hypothetical protein VW455_14490 [Nitrospinota bacterium]
MEEKNIETLIDLARKLGKGICDTGTFEERLSKYLILKWKYKGNTFLHKFPGSINATTLNYQYYQMRKNLRAGGLGPPVELMEKFSGSMEQFKLLQDIWSHLRTDDEGGTPYGGDVEKG